MDQVARTGRLDGKAVAALYSVAVNVVLIAAKLLVGLLTGSVAILADAAYSFLDLSASIFAYAGIRTAAKPADEDHAWGHAKAENISSLVQMFLLGATCIAIVIESVRRLVVVRGRPRRHGDRYRGKPLPAARLSVTRRQRRARVGCAPFRFRPLGLAGRPDRHHAG